MNVNRSLLSFGAVHIVVFDPDETQPIDPLADLIDITHYELPPASTEAPAWFIADLEARLANYTPGDDLTALVTTLWRMVG